MFTYLSLKSRGGPNHYLIEEGLNFRDVSLILCAIMKYLWLVLLAKIVNGLLAESSHRLVCVAPYEVLDVCGKDDASFTGYEPEVRVTECPSMHDVREL